MMSAIPKSDVKARIGIGQGRGGQDRMYVSRTSPKAHLHVVFVRDSHFEARGGLVDIGGFLGNSFLKCEILGGFSSRRASFGG